jgi:Mrp family chromosome partitioning ATPase
VEPQRDLAVDVTVLRASRRFWWVIVLCVSASCGLLLAGTAGLSAVGVVKDLHREQATIEVHDPVTATIVSTGRSSDPQRYAANQLAVLTSQAVVDRGVVLSREAVVSKDVQDQLSVSGAPDNDIVKLSYKNESRTVAAGVVKGVVESYQEFVAAQQGREIDSAVAALDRQIAAANAELTTLSARVASSQEATTVRQSLAALEAQRAQLLAGRNVSLVTVLSMPDEKAPPASTARSVESLRLFSAVLLGLIVGCALAYALARRRPRVADAMRPSLLLRAPVIAELSRNGNSKFPLRTSPNSATSEAFRIAAARLSVPNGERSGRLHAVIGMPSGVEPVVAAANVALAMTQQGLRVALVDLGPHGHDFNSALERELVANNVRNRRFELHELKPDAAGGNPFWDAQLSILALGNERSESRSERHRGRTRHDPQRAADQIPGVNLARIDELLDLLRKFHDHVLVAFPDRGFGAVQFRIERQVDDALVIVRHNGLLTDVDKIARQLELAGTPVVGYLYDRS